LNCPYIVLRLFPDALEDPISAKRMVNVFVGLHGVGMLSDVTLHANAMSGLLSGVCFGFLHVVAPDHLGTIMTLSSATTKGNAFAVGAACGFGHSFGLVFTATIFLSLRSAFTFNVEAWEYYGNHLIGASMVLCALYFIMREGTFLVQNEDGTYTAQPCSCHPAQPITPMPEGACLPCDGAASELERTPLLAYRARGCGEQHSSVSEQALLQRAGEGRDLRGALIGVFQGACCPIAMVGLTFIAALPVMGIVFFLVTFMAVSAFGTASVAVIWAFATSNGICGGLPPKFAYRMSCGFTLILGIFWLIANYCGILEKMNYAEAAQHAEMNHLDNK